MHELLHQLVRRFNLEAAQARQLWQMSQLHARPPALRGWLEGALAAVAALLLGAGLVFWVAANWPEQTRTFKFNALQAAVLLPALAALALPRLRTACLLLATLALGALLAFVGQTYQTGADPWQLFAAWAALALPWVLAARRALLWAAWLLLAALALALWGLPLELARYELAHPRLQLALAGWALLLALPWLLTWLGLAPSRHAHWLAGGRAPSLLLMRVAALAVLPVWVAMGLMGLIGLIDRGGGALYAICLLLTAAAGGLMARLRDVAALGLALLALDLLLLAGLGYGLLKSNTNVMGMLLVGAVVSAACLGGSAALLLRLQRQWLAEEGCG